MFVLYPNSDINAERCGSPGAGFIGDPVEPLVICLHLTLKHLLLHALTFEYQPIVLFSINQIVFEDEATPPVSGQRPLTT
jgi:hypothetical protein